MPLGQWLDNTWGSLFGSSSPGAVGSSVYGPPGSAAPSALGGLLDPRGIREQAFYSGLGSLSQGLLAAGLPHPATQGSLIPQALGAFQPAYSGALSQGYQQAAAEQQLNDRALFERQISGLPPAEQQIARTLGREGYARYITQQNQPYSLRQGETRMGPNGPIAAVPAAPTTLSQGQVQVGPDGRVIASVAPAPHYAGSPDAGGVYAIQPPPPTVSGGQPGQPQAPSQGGQPQGQPQAAPTSASVGARANNPLNLGGEDAIRTGGWSYATPEDGTAAAVRQITLNASRNNGTLTPAQLAQSWIRPTAGESPQAFQQRVNGYAQRIATGAQAPLNAPLNLSDPAVMARVVRTMAQVEQGILPQGWDDAITRGVQQGFQPGPIRPGSQRMYGGAGGAGPRAQPTIAAQPGAASPPTTAAPTAAAPALAGRAGLPPNVSMVVPPMGDFSGQSLEAQAWNIVNNPNADRSSPRYAAAYSILTEPRPMQVPDPNNPAALMTVLVPRQLPAHVTPPTGTAQAPSPAAAGGAAPPGAAVGGASQPPQQPPPAAGPTPVPGSSQVPPATREVVRRSELEGRRILDAADNFERIAAGTSGFTRLRAWLRDPTSPEAAQLQQAYENLIMASRSEGFANTGVLQPAEMTMLANQFRDPATARGALASNDTRSAQLSELRNMVQTVINRQRQSIGLPAIEFPATGGGASPPTAAAPSRIIDYDAQGRPIPPRAAQ